MDEIIKEYSSENKKFSLAIFDIDNFKNVNDTYGHQTGDVVLEGISKVVSKNKGQKDVFSRYGGEEFTIIFKDEGSDRAYKKAEHLRKKIEEADLLRGKRELTVSIGIATFNEHSKNKNDLIKKADQALYEAKKESKNIVKIWNESLGNSLESVDKLAGIITGVMAKDYDKISAVLEAIDIIRSDINLNNKLSKVMGTILKITESKNAYLFTVIDGEEIGIIRHIKRGEKGWVRNEYYNSDIVNEVIKTRVGIYKIDWDEVLEARAINYIPKWNSICAVPLINKNKLKGILYLAAPSNEKEFDYGDYNYINNLGHILSILL